MKLRLRRPGGRALAVGLGTGVATLLLPVAFGVHWHSPWEAIPGFYAGYGALGCAAIVVVSKWLGQRGLQQREDWYE